MFPHSDNGRWEELPLALWGALLVTAGLAGDAAVSILGLVRFALSLPEEWRQLLILAGWYCGIPIVCGLLLILTDLFCLLPGKRQTARRQAPGPVTADAVTVVLTAYNDEESIGASVRDFLSQPQVQRVIVVSNNSKDRTLEVAQAAGAIAVNESNPGYGPCVYRCFLEALRYPDAQFILLCEGDMTFRAADIPKFLSYIPHADVVNGTRIVEQLRDPSTQLTTFVFYGNFFVGKLLELRHLGRGTFTDVGTTYKLLRRDSLKRILEVVNPRVNLEFNAHFLDRVLASGERMVECPVTFHPRVGQSKGAGVNNLRALKVGLGMIIGLCFGWSLVQGPAVTARRELLKQS
ncbi:MAG: glycosyltransferase family 2 protein [Acidobacteria bacterium]|nr:glycosyltransferase family 2 protein [Acidobacteriota bacterium]